MIALLSSLLFIAAGPVAPAGSIDRLHAAPGIRVELIAAEPDVVDPVAVAFDERGRMFVVENRGYPEDDSGAGSIALLTDDDGDGKYSRVSTFQDGLNFPNGVMPWKGGVIVTDAPQVLFLQDTDGDHIADTHEVLLDGFSLGGSTQLRVSHPTLGLDNWIHFTNGLSGGEVTNPEHPETGPLSLGLHDVRFDPFTGAVEPQGGRAQFGLTFDDFGHKFVCSNRNHIQHVVLSPQDLARNPSFAFGKTAHDIPDHGAAAKVFPLTGAPTTAYAHAGTFTAACGLRIYRGASLPSEYQGNAFVCEPTGNLVHRDILEQDDGTFVSHRGRDGVEFLASEDDWFRPVYLTNGPGGALYLCDMYRGTIEHPTYLPGEVAAVTDFDAGKDRGRIYRISAAPRETPLISAADTDALITLLSDADGWTRDTARRLLLEERDPAAIPALRALAESDAPAATRVRALSLLQGFDALEASDVIAAIADSDPRVREFGARLVRTLAQPGETLSAALRKLADDPDGHVRFAAALALGDEPSPDVLPSLVEVLAAAPDDEWTRAAVLSGTRGLIAEFADRYWDASGESESNLETAEAIGSILARERAPEETGDVIATTLLRDAPAGAGWRMAFLNGFVSAALRNGTLNAPAIESLRPRLDDDSAARLDALVAEAKAWTEGAEGSTQAERFAAIELLGAASFDTAADSLETLLSTATPAPVQARAIRSLFQNRDARAVAMVLDEARWNAFTGQARDAALSGLLSIPTGAALLLDAVESDAVPGWSVPAQYRNRLVRHSDADVQARAKAAFETPTQSDRMKVYEAHRAILERPGDAKNGRQVFENTCASCHRFGDLGHEVGPDLTGIGSQSSDSILLHILVPNWLKLPGYESYLVETDAFEEYTGIIAAESESAITLRAAYGIETAIPRDSITSMKLMALSMMPAELEQTMSEQDLRDLIAFLKREE